MNLSWSFNPANRRFFCRQEVIATSTAHLLVCYPWRNNKGEMPARRQSLPDPPPTLAPPSSPELESETDDNVTEVVVSPEDSSTLNNNDGADAEVNVPTHTHSVTNESDGQDGSHPSSSSTGIILDSVLAPDVETEVHRFMVETLGTLYSDRQEAAQATPAEREHGTAQTQQNIVVGSLIGVAVDTGNGNSIAVERRDGNFTGYNINGSEDEKKNSCCNIFLTILVFLLPVAILTGVILLLSRNPEKDMPSTLPSSTPTTTSPTSLTTTSSTKSTVKLSPTPQPSTNQMVSLSLSPKPSSYTTSTPMLIPTSAPTSRPTPTPTPPQSSSYPTTFAPTSKPTFSQSLTLTSTPSLSQNPSVVPTRYSNWLDVLAGTLNIDVSSLPADSATASALDWMAYSDPLRNELLLATDSSLLERYIIVVLYFATNGTSWDNSYDFLSDMPVCMWNNGIPRNAFGDEGIYCNDDDEVVSITLHRNQLTGTIPSELASLTSLEELDLSFNLLLHGSIPSEFGLLSSLSRIHLWSNELTGTIPSELGLLELTSLLLNGNRLTGTIPSEIWLVTSLRALILWANEFGGSLPSELGSLDKLVVLNLENSQLTGSIPSEVGLLTSLTRLVLSHNQLTGPLPSEFGLLNKLTLLNTSVNRLVGAIPAEFGFLTFLTGLYLSNNEFTGSIPSELGLLTDLQALYLCNNQLTGMVPPGLDDVPTLCLR